MTEGGKIATPAFGGLAMTTGVILKNRDCHGFPYGKPRNDKKRKIATPAFGGLASTGIFFAMIFFSSTYINPFS